MNRMMRICGAMLLGAAVLTPVGAGSAKPAAVKSGAPLPTWSPNPDFEQRLSTVNNKMYDFAIRPPDGWNLTQVNTIQQGRLYHAFLWIGPRQGNNAPLLLLRTTVMSRSERAKRTTDQILKQVLSQIKGQVSLLSPTINRSNVQQGLIAGERFSRMYFKFPITQLNNTGHGFLYTGYHGGRELVFVAFDIEPGWSDTGDMCEASVLTFHKA